MSGPDRRLMREKARELGVPEDKIDEVLSMPSEELEMLEALTVGHSFLASLLSGNRNKTIGYDELDNGLAVSTVVTADCGPETAIINGDGHAVPVERYATEEYAEVGHREWIEKMNKRPKTIRQIGWVAMMEAKEVELIYAD